MQPHLSSVPPGPNLRPHPNPLQNWKGVTGIREGNAARAKQWYVLSEIAPASAAVIWRGIGAHMYSSVSVSKLRSNGRDAMDSPR